MARRLWSLFAALLLGSLACEAQSAPSQSKATKSAKDEPQPGDTPEPSRSEELVPDPITHPCVVEAAKFDVVLRDADNTCEADADCDCYPGGVTRKAGCGGVTSSKVATKLHGIAKEFHALGCDLVQDCAASLCEPKCVDGKCE